ncbi:MAG TPA: type I phosphomannose isomerase catalytic subunit [Bacteroidales bacterium]|nr:type I phosphomannose isomerase catalytic subunit [Bacteroidales bacterium]
MKDYTNYSVIPLKQRSNRVWRTYRGGLLIDSWKGNKVCEDGDTPEEWVASTIIARGNDRPPTEGLTVIELADGYAFLKDMIESNKEAFLGKRIASEYGDTALLIKMLDSCERLSIQVHPDKEFAFNFLGSQFGKTEGWYVLGGRTVLNEESYVLFGFKEGVDKQKWSQLFHDQDIDGMINSLHKVYVKPGDVFIINGGVPHAIGSGCFLLEIQEPTDYTMRVEKTTQNGSSINDMLVHQGVGEERMLDCFHYDSYSYEETMRRWKIDPKVVSKSMDFQLRALIDSDHTHCFSLHELVVYTRTTTQPNDAFFVAVVYAGKGSITTSAIKMDIKAGDEFFIPASLGQMEWEAEETLRVLLCYPPN